MEAYVRKAEMRETKVRNAQTNQQTDNTLYFKQ